MNCSQTRELIDEQMSPVLAQDPDAGRLSPEAAGHIASCIECRTFSEQRISLGRLVASIERVEAPANFEMLLKARMARRAAPEKAGWFVPVFSFKFAGAAALLLCAVLAGYFSSRPKVTPPATAKAEPDVIIDYAEPSFPGGVANVGGTNHPSIRTQQLTVTTPVKSRIATRRNQAMAAEADIQLAYAARDSMNLLLRAKDKLAEREVRVSAVSVGAEPLFEVTRQSEPARIVRTSF